MSANLITQEFIPNGKQLIILLILFVSLNYTYDLMSFLGSLIVTFLCILIIKNINLVLKFRKIFFLRFF